VERPLFGAGMVFYDTVFFYLQVSVHDNMYVAVLISVYLQ